MKSVQIRSYFWSVFSCIWTEYGPEITPYLDTFHAVKHINIIAEHLLTYITVILRKFLSLKPCQVGQNSMSLYLQEISIQHVVVDLELTYIIKLEGKNLARVEYSQNKIHLSDKQIDQV